MKKTYIAPNLTILWVEPQSFIASSLDHDSDEEDWDLANKYPENGKVTTNADLPISAKHYDAWDTWDE